MQAELINLVLDDLKKLKKDLAKMDIWKKEIELIDSKINAFSDRDIAVMGYSSGGKTYSIDDLLESDETKRNILESKIIKTEYNLKCLEVYINELDDNEQDIIKNRYINNPKEVNSFQTIAKDMMFSKTSIKRIHDKAIEKIAMLKYESIAIA